MSSRRDFIPKEALLFNNAFIALSLLSLKARLSSLFFFCSSLINSFTFALDSLEVFSYKSVFMTTPFTPGSAFLDASFTSPAFSPKIALRSFSSGEGSVSPLGDTLPIKISSSFTIAPTLIKPSSSSCAVDSSLTFGISGVNSSLPRLVSRTSNSISLICKDVNTSSLTSLSLITIASSKLYPFQGIRATKTFFPRDNSPFDVEAPSAISWPALSLSPCLTIVF